MKAVAPLRSSVSSSIVGLMCLVIKMVRFASRMSTLSRISFGLLSLCGVTILDTHSVGPETFSIISSCSSFCIPEATLMHVHVKWCSIMFGRDRRDGFVNMKCYLNVFETANPVTCACVLCEKFLRSQHLRVITKML